MPIIGSRRASTAADANRRAGAPTRSVRPVDVRCARLGWSGALASGNLALVRVDYDTELRLHNERLRRSFGIGPGARVLDIGCGTGQTTRDAARAAVDGAVLGVDTSAPAIERARELAYGEGLHNVTYAVADAQVHSFAGERFDVAISRFGTMFFAEPVSAFSNIARALRPGGRLVMMVWQEYDRNEWATSIDNALTAGQASLGRPTGAMNPFSLGDPAGVTMILDAAGFADWSFEDVREPVYYGPDVAAALEWVRDFAGVGDALQQLGPVSREHALDQLARTLAAHARTDGIWFDSRAWIVTARRA
jgi:SAM-dependent methyltransferase